MRSNKMPNVWFHCETNEYHMLINAQLTRMNLIVPLFKRRVHCSERSVAAAEAKRAPHGEWKPLDDSGPGPRCVVWPSAVWSPRSVSQGPLFVTSPPVTGCCSGRVSLWETSHRLVGQSPDEIKFLGTGVSPAFWTTFTPRSSSPPGDLYEERLASSAGDSR
ncbi:hypothetical protein AVEN_64198-1 [Araneus ventricosus]|uniref:Uncharacterized protein n=1 Tax=Araneus ventricosus TaxID=182803 RepID=A0A4Y2VIF6_ARAVE|nr:hypothetical protein AVEN_64198-1 [Araneus ventricosus]